MKKTIFLIILLLVPSQALPDNRPGQAVELNSSGDIADVERLDREVSRLIAKVRQCAAAGLAPASDCYCLYPSKLASTRKVYSSLLTKHPEWEDQSLLWWDDNRSYSSNIHLRGLKRRIERPCSSKDS